MLRGPYVEFFQNNRPSKLKISTSTMARDDNSPIQDSWDNDEIEKMEVVPNETIANLQTATTTNDEENPILLEQTDPPTPPRINSTITTNGYTLVGSNKPIGKPPPEPTPEIAVTKPTPGK